MEWDSHTRSNIMLANNQIRKSRVLRSGAEIILRAVCEDICKAYDKTNQSFEKRILETKLIKNKLENELAEVSRHSSSFLRWCSAKVRLKKTMIFVYQYSLLKNINKFQTTKQANDVKNALIKIEQPIKINKDHMSLVITRINERERRPGVEKCK